MIITDSDKRFLLSLKQEDIDFNMLIGLFGNKASTKNGKMTHIKSRFEPSDEFTLDANEYFNKEKVTTTVGLFIYNKFIVEDKFKDILGYINITIDKKVLGGIEDKLAKALLNDIITQQDFVDYLNKSQWLTMKFHIVISGSFSINTIKPDPSVISKKKKLFKENEEQIKNKDLQTVVKIENELVATAFEKLKNDHGMDLYNSGARGSFPSNYKNLCIMRGPVYNPVNDDYDIVESNFMSGIDKKDIPVYGNLIVEGAFPKAVGTQVSGYLTKQLTAAMQTVVLDVYGSDCGSKGYLEMVLTPYLKNDFYFRYIIDRNKLILLDNSNIDKYIGKKIKLRSIMYCISDKICNKCAGDMYYKLGLINLGLTATRVSSTLLNLNMKKFHDTTVQTTPVNINTLII